MEEPYFIEDKAYQEDFGSVVTYFVRLGESFPMLTKGCGIRGVLEQAIKQRITRLHALLATLVPYLLGRERRRQRTTTSPPSLKRR